MKLSTYRRYAEYIERERSRNNKTSRHIYSMDMELMGVLGELAVRKYLKLPLKLHTGFDGGTDLIYGDKRINVKATKIAGNKHKHLQWPAVNPVLCDVAILVGVDLETFCAEVLGWATKEEILKAPVNRERVIPCHEIPVQDLHLIGDLCANDIAQRHS